MKGKIMAISNAISIKFRKHRSVIADDVSPAVSEKYSNLSSDILTKFQKVDGRRPVILLNFKGTGPSVGGTAARGCKIRVYFITETIDFQNAKKKENVLNWVDVETVTNNITRLQLEELEIGALGSSVFVAVTELTSNTTVDIFIGDDSNN